MSRPRRISRILVADDEPLIAETLTQILLNSGYRVKAALSGEEAVELARDFEPNLFITDFMMPGISGIEAAEQIRRFLPSCEIILISGAMPNVDGLLDSQRATLSLEFMAKPLSPSALLRRIAALD